jgi:hypothetical protein
MSMAKPCAHLKSRHTKTKGCLVHKSKNPGRSPASNNPTLTDQSNFRQIGPSQGMPDSRRPQLGPTYRQQSQSVTEINDQVAI